MCCKPVSCGFQVDWSILLYVCTVYVCFGLFCYFVRKSTCMWHMSLYVSVTIQIH